MIPISRILVAGAAVFIIGCRGKGEPKPPPRSAPIDQSASKSAMSSLSEAARLALDSGNVLFRAKAYDQALAQYQRSAHLTPNDVVALLGIMMVAEATSDSTLALSTLAKIRKIDPGAADSAVLMPHSKLMRAHPGGVQPPAT